MYKSYVDISKITFIPPNVPQHNTESKTDKPKNILYHQITKTKQNKNTLIVRTNNNSSTVRNNIPSANKNNIHTICKNTKNYYTNLRKFSNKRYNKIKQPKNNKQRTNQYLVPK